MPSDFGKFLWLLKFGALANLYFVMNLLALATPDPHVVVPGLILIVVSAFRCLFPNRYLDNVVFHDSPLSSIFVTRVLATASEVAYIYQFSYVIRVLNVDSIGWVNVLSWWMVIQVVISQGFVWAAILTKRLALYFYEELGWFILFFAHAVASVSLYLGAKVDGDFLNLLTLNLVFAAGYLPWQVFHLRSLRAEARTEPSRDFGTWVSWREGLGDAIRLRNPRTDSKGWGGLIGLTWMVAYWASLIPFWVYHVARVVSST